MNPPTSRSSARVVRSTQSRKGPSLAPRPILRPFNKFRVAPSKVEGRQAQDREQRRAIVIANWKMYLSASESVRAARSTRTLTVRLAGRSVDIVLCPAFPLLPAVREALKGSRLQLGAQDLHHEASGPYTGDVAAAHLRGLARYVIVGHSERRRWHGETDEQVAKKMHRAVRAGLLPIVCVGETSEERDAGETVAKIRRQVSLLAAAVPALSLARCVFAYEPIWAISRGPGQPSPQPEPADAAHIVGLIRRVAAETAGHRHAERLRIVYGGSVDGRTVSTFISEPGVDGVLVGAASTTPADFFAIVREVIRCRS